jgi:hypothetical protein
MKQKGFHRKLTAILSADVAGYSRLTHGCGVEIPTLRITNFSSESYGSNHILHRIVVNEYASVIDMHQQRIPTPELAIHRFGCDRATLGFVHVDHHPWDDQPTNQFN